MLCSLTSFSQSISDYQWLLGKWQINNPKEKKLTTETWSFVENAYIGHSFTLTDGVKTFEEIMKLSYVSGRLTYSVSTPENNNDWIDFTMEKNKNKNELLFENKAHDFPKYISYKLASPNKINAEVGDNAETKIPFNYTRTTNQDSIDIGIVISRMQLAYFEGRYRDIAKFYSNDAIVTNGDLFVKGRKALDKYWSDFNAYGGTWKLTSEWLKIDGMTAVQKGKSLIMEKHNQASNVNFLLNWRKENGEWKIVQDVYW